MSVPSPRGRVEAVSSARGAPVAVICAPMLSSARDVEDDRRLSEVRKGAGVTAILHSGYPVRHRDKDLGPDQPHLFALGIGLSDIAPSETAEPFDLTPGPGDALRGGDYDLSSDGQFVVAAWQVHGAGVTRRSALMRIGMATGARSVIVDDSYADLRSPVISPDCSAVAYIRESHATASGATRITLGMLSFGEDPIDLAGSWDRWPISVTWVCDGSALIVTADDNGRCPMWRIDVGTGDVTRVTSDDFAYSDVVTVPGGAIYALRSSVAIPPHPVRVDTDGAVAVLPCIDPPILPGSLTELTARTTDDLRVRSWLVLPDSGEPAPLLLWIHGGPRDSWNRWSWEWNPWLLSARGYAVVLPDPALSTGYGQGFIQRGWGSWGPATFDDLMAITEVAVADPVSTQRVPLPWADRLVGSWPTGWRATPIASMPSSPMPASGHWTSSARPPIRPPTGSVKSRHSSPLTTRHTDSSTGSTHRCWSSTVIGTIWYRSTRPCGCGSNYSRIQVFPRWMTAVVHTGSCTFPPRVIGCAHRSMSRVYQVVIAFLAAHVLEQDGEMPETLG